MTPLLSGDCEGSDRIRRKNSIQISLDASCVNTLAASRLRDGGAWGGLLLQAWYDRSSGQWCGTSHAKVAAFRIAPFGLAMAASQPDKFVALDLVCYCSAHGSYSLGSWASLFITYVAHKPPNQSMKPTLPLRYNRSVFATTPCRPLSLAR
jgi:hypothetical protein